jgi:thioesterase domain-containing protein
MAVVISLVRRRHVANLFRWEGLSDVVLCGHSYGGMVVSGVAERVAAAPGAVRAMVFLDAFVPEDGQSVADLASPAVRDAIAALAARGPCRRSPRRRSR